MTIEFLQTWLEKRRHYAASTRAIQTFRELHGIHPSSASIVRSDDEATIVRVTYPRRGTAPGGPVDYAWFALSKAKQIRELTAEDVSTLGLENHMP